MPPKLDVRLLNKYFASPTRHFDLQPAETLEEEAQPEPLDQSGLVNIHVGGCREEGIISSADQQNPPIRQPCRRRSDSVRAV